MKKNKPFKIRCSAIGQIMTNSRKKTEILSQTCKSYVDKWLKEQMYGKKYEFSNKYTEKGITVEEENIEFLAEYFDKFLIKNEKHFENEYCTGTPDLILPNEIWDVKSSWDCFTFPIFEKELKTKDYYWQAQGYMWLTAKQNYKLVYVLSDTPKEIIEREAYRYYYANPHLDLDIFEVIEEFTEKMTYQNTPDDMKVKVFEILRNEDDIKSIENRVISIREYINTNIILKK